MTSISGKLELQTTIDTDKVSWNKITLKIKTKAKLTTFDFLSIKYKDYYIGFGIP